MDSALMQKNRALETQGRTKGSQPGGLYVLFLTEMWERFSYYGMRALLVLYLVTGATKGGLGWPEASADHLYAWYTGLVYLTPLIGGYLADRFIGTHRSLVLGGLIIAAGHFSLAIPSLTTFYLGLVLIIVGTGFFKPNVSTMVGQLYGEDDPRRDSGFTLFYMGINLGALLGSILCGYLAESPSFGWHWGFGAAGVGMVLGLIVYVILKPRYLGSIGDVPTRLEATADERKTESAPLTKVEKERILAIVIVALFVVFFWAAYEQAGSSMNLFALEHTNRLVSGFEIPASWFQSVNPAAILLGAPLFAWLWTRLAAKGKEPSTPTKMGFGLILLAVGFAFMVAGAKASAGGALASPLWLIGAYVFQTAGELCLSPVGLSLVTKLAPKRFASLLMGLWFLSNFVANIIAGYLAGAASLVASGKVFTLMGGLADFYFMFVASSLVVGVAFFAMAPLLKRLMHGQG